MEHTPELDTGNAVEVTPLARVFGAHLKHLSTAAPDVMAALGEKLVMARRAGDSFIELDENELQAVKANPFLTSPEEGLLCLEGNHLYLFREYRDEVTAAESIAARLKVSIPEYTVEESDFPEYFNSEQKNAVRNSLNSSFSIISGGPGTGKTTVIAALVALEVKRNKAIDIAIAAPTGKAAELLTQGLKDTPHPIKARTLHSLFKASADTGRFGKNSTEPLACDLLIIDESSMLSLDTVAKVLKGLPLESRLILSGDHCQLEAIGSGAVLQSLLCCQTPDTPSGRLLEKAGAELLINYRSKEAPFIQELARDIREEKLSPKELTDKIVNTQSPDFTCRRAEKDFYAVITAAAEAHWKKLPATAKKMSAENIQKAFEILKSFRIVTAAREGKEGCAAINRKILEKLRIPSIHAPGSAVLITRNCRRTGLSNGDVGIIFADTGSGTLKAVFEHLENPLSIYELPPHESAFAMTVHKAQGSGFAEVFFQLPSKENGLLSRELFYTALTRAAQKITICGASEVIQYALEHRSLRKTMLAERILRELEKKNEK